MSATQWTDGLGNTGYMTTGGWVDNTAAPLGTYYPSTGNYYIQTWPVTISEPPRECSGDVHVFPCPHCDKCKCGGAMKVTAKAKSKR